MLNLLDVTAINEKLSHGESVELDKGIYIPNSFHAVKMDGKTVKYCVFYLDNPDSCLIGNDTEILIPNDEDYLMAFIACKGNQPNKHMTGFSLRQITRTAYDTLQVLAASGWNHA